MKSRLFYALIIFALVLAACGGAAETPATTVTEAPADQAVATTGDTTATTGDTAATTGDTAAAGDKPGDSGSSSTTTTNTNTNTNTETSSSGGTTAESACPQYYTETFDGDTCWYYDQPIIVSSPNLRQIEIGLHSAALRFRINIEETYAYVFYAGAEYGDVRLSADVISTMNNSHGIVLVCNATDAGWYEARVSTGGTYAIYSYTQALKDAGENPYYDYANSVTGLIIPGINHLNNVAIECVGNTFTLLANNQVVWSDQIPGMSSGGLVGIGTIANVNFPVEIDFDNITIEQP
jgi:hypothetical protein